MDYSVLEKSTLFAGIPAKELRDDLETVPHHIQCYDKGEQDRHYSGGTRAGTKAVSEREPDQCFRA